MVVLQGLVAVIVRSAGKIVNTAFGWATIILFGKVPEERQIYLTGIAFASVAWLIALLGIAFPSIGTFLLILVPLPEWVDRNLVRLAMLGASVLIPLSVGFLALHLLEPRDRPAEVARKTAIVLRGYPATLGLALTLIMLTVLAPVSKLIALSHRCASQHVPVLVEPEDYHHGRIVLAPSSARRP